MVFVAKMPEVRPKSVNKHAVKDAFCRGCS